MIIEKLMLQEGSFNSEDTFSKKKNLIFSKNNSSGKSTYCRLMFYALGYSIPSMRGLDFSKVYTEITFSEKGLHYKVIRDINYLEVYEYKTGTKLSFSLPSDHSAFLSYVFQYDNIKVLNNLLGFIYIDQDKGWSLLNRGTVIGRIKFSIEELLSGLKGVNCDSLLEDKYKLEKEIKKYKTMLDLGKLQEEVFEMNGEVFVSDIENEYKAQISMLNLKISNCEKAKKEIDNVLSKHNSFLDYIDSMNLVVRQDNVEIPVNRNTINYSSDSTEYLRARKSLLYTDMAKLKKELTNVEDNLEKYYMEHTPLLNSEETEGSKINRHIASLSINQNTINLLLADLQNKLSKVNSLIKSTLKSNNKYINQVYSYVLAYTKLLGVDDKIIKKEDYIFTSDLKSLGGAILQKIVFAFKVAFLKVIEKEMNTKLFMVLDSPKSKELDNANTKAIEALINNELHENQIFIASIYAFNNEKCIELKGTAINNRIN